MGDGSLSQDEIDALLQGADDMMAPVEPTTAVDSRSGGGSLSFSQQNSIKDLLSSSMSAVVPPLSGYLGGRSLFIANPYIEVKAQDAVRNDFPGQYVQISMDYSGALYGKNLIIFNLRDAGAISSLMMGDESGAPPAEFTDAHQSTIQEFTNQLLSSLATKFGGRLGGGINTTPASLTIINNSIDLQLPMGELAKITYDISIEGVINSKFYHIMDMNLASGLLKIGGAASQPVSQGQQYQQQQSQVGISPVKFPPLDEGIAPSMVGDISLILDVPMTLTVELGRTTKLVQEILGLGEGSIIELDKLAGEPVDLLVNGKLIAKGEVVVIDENFGVRVTDIVSPDERLASYRSE